MDWFPWGDEASEKAKEEDNPIFLSIGAEYTKEYGLKDDKSTYYICQNNTCSPPTHDLAELAKKL